LNEKTTQLILRLPENLHVWLKENIPEGGINDFIVGLIQQHVQSLKPVAPKIESNPHLEWLKKQENEIIFGNVTRGELLRKLDRNRIHYVKEIAGKLGITYKQAYNIIPLLEREGYIVKYTKRENKKESENSKEATIEDFDFNIPTH
jgi:hypothetical protein